MLLNNALSNNNLNYSNQQSDELEDDYFISRSLLALLAPKAIFFDGPSLDVADRLRRYVPFRKIGTLTTIDYANGFFTFTLSSEEDSRDYMDFARKINDFYSKEENRIKVSRYEVQTDRDYICECVGELGGRGYFRCRIGEPVYTDTEETREAFLIDLGRFAVVYIDNLFALDPSFNEGNLYYAFTIKCSALDAATLEKLGLPPLDDFRVGNIVEVLICSIHEPCLGIIGSVTNVGKRIRSEAMLGGLDGELAAKWISLLTSISPSTKPLKRRIKGSLAVGDLDEWCLVTIANMHSIESIYVRDAAASIRLNALQKYLNNFYEDGENREKMRMTTERYSKLRRGTPLVIFDGAQFFRAKVHSVCVEHELLDVECIDYPHMHFHGLGFNDDGTLFMLSESFDLPAQCFPINLTKNLPAVDSRRLSNLAFNYINVGSVAFVRSFRGGGGFQHKYVLEFADEQPDLLTVLFKLLAEEKEDEGGNGDSNEEQNSQSTSPIKTPQLFPRNALRPILRRVPFDGSPERVFNFVDIKEGLETKSDDVSSSTDENESNAEEAKEKEDLEDKQDDKNEDENKEEVVEANHEEVEVGHPRFNRKQFPSTPPRTVEAISHNMSR